MKASIVLAAEFYKTANYEVTLALGFDRVETKIPYGIKAAWRRFAKARNAEKDARRPRRRKGG